MVTFGADGGLVGKCQVCAYTFTVLNPERTPPHFESERPFESPFRCPGCGHLDVEHEGPPIGCTLCDCALSCIGYALTEPADE